jgi:O-antigen/teichoic acid export membrane protein
MQERKPVHLAENILWLVANRLGRVVVGLVTLGAIARHLGVAEFGLLSYAISIAAVFGSLASLGLEGVVVREQIRNPAGAQQILATSFWLRIGGGLVAILAAFLSAIALGDGFQTAVLVLVVATGFLPSALEVIELHFQKDVRAKATVKVRFLAILVSGGMKLALVAMGAPLVWFAVMQAVEQTLMGLGLWWVYRQDGGRLFRFKPCFKVAGSLLCHSWALALSGIAVAVYFRSEQFVVKSLTGDEGLGLYAASLRIMELWGFLSGAVTTTVFPLLVGLNSQNPEKFRLAVQALYDALTWAGIALAVCVTASAWFFVPMVFGEAFEATSTVLMIHSWTAPVTFSAHIRAVLMIMEEQNHLHLPIALGGLLVYVPSTVLLTTAFGIPGAAISLLGNYWLTGFATSFMFRSLRQEGISQWNAFLAPFRIQAVASNLQALWSK